MAKSISISLEHGFTSRAGTLTVAEALAWVEKHAADESEEGDEGAPRYSPGDLVVYAVRRMQALAKDGKRHASGRLARHLYAPRVDALKVVPKPLAALVEENARVEARLAPAKPTKPSAAGSRAAKPATAARRAGKA